mgnify:CR=1 FL=1
MGKLFDLDSPVMRALNRVTDLLWLNFLVLICCLPVITAGAAFTAAHYVCLKMCRDEESYITREYFKSFKLNFKQSTLIWLLVLLVTFILGADYYIIKNVDLNIPKILQGVMVAAGVLFLFMSLWVFAVQSRFENKVFRTMKNALSLSIAQLPRTFLMIILHLLPIVCLLIYRIMPLFFFFGFSVPIFFSAKLYNKMFKKLEDKILEHASAEEGEESGETEKVFSDKPLIEENAEKQQ